MTEAILSQLLSERIVILDGAMGTMIQRYRLDEAAFRDGNQVWGRVVADIPAFCREFVALLESRL